MEITLKDDDEQTGTDQRINNPDDDAYRERTMTLNGKIVAKGAPSAVTDTDSDIQNGRNRGTENLLPWIWDSESGEKIAA